METNQKGYQQPDAVNQAFGMVMQPKLSIPPPPLPPPPLVLPPSSFVDPPSPLTLINFDQAKNHMEVAEASDRMENHHRNLSSMTLSSSSVNDYATYLNASYKCGMPHVNSNNLMPPYEQCHPKIRMVNFGNTPGYYEHGCWYNSKYNRVPWALPTQAPPTTSPSATVLLTTAPPLPLLPPPITPPPPPPPPPQTPPPKPTATPSPPPPLPQQESQNPLSSQPPPVKIHSFNHNQPMATLSIQPPEASIKPPQTLSDPQVVEVNILPGIQLRRTASKLIIDIDFGNFKSEDEIKNLSNENSKKTLIREQMTQTVNAMNMELEPPISEKIENVVASMKEVKIEPIIRAFPHQLKAQHFIPGNQMQIQMNPQYAPITYPSYPMQMPMGLYPTNSPRPNDLSKYKGNTMDIKRENCFVQRENKPSFPTPYPNMYTMHMVNNMPSMPSIVHAPPIGINRDQRLVHNLQVEKKSSSPTPYLYGYSNMQGNKADNQIDYHHYHQHPNSIPVTPSARPLRNGSTNGRPQSSPNFKTANSAQLPILGTRSPSKCKPVRKTKSNQLQTVPLKNNPKRQNLNNTQNSKSENVKENYSKQPLVEEKKCLHNIMPKKIEKCLVDSPKKIKIKWDRANTSKAVPLTTYRSNMFDILGTLDTNSNGEEFEGTESDVSVTLKNDPQESIKSEKKELKKLKKKKLKLMKLQRQKQLEEKLAKNIDKRKEKRRRETLQAEFVMLKKIALKQKEEERQNNEPKIDANHQITQSSPVWCPKKYTTSSVILQSKVQNVAQCSESLRKRRLLIFDDSNSSSSDGEIMSCSDCSDTSLSSGRNIMFKFENSLPPISQDIFAIPLTSHPVVTHNYGDMGNQNVDLKVTKPQQERHQNGYDQTKKKNMEVITKKN